MKKRCIGIIAVCCFMSLFASSGFCQFDSFKKNFDKFKHTNKEETTIANETPQTPQTPEVSPGAGGTKTVTGSAGIRMRVPSGWTISHNEKNLFAVHSPGGSGVGVSVNFNDYGQGFPVEASLQAYQQSSQKEQQEGKLVSYQNKNVGGVPGIERIEAPAAGGEDPRRITWVGYKGSVGINLVASARSKDFDSNAGLLQEIIASIEFN